MDTVRLNVVNALVPPSPMTPQACTVQAAFVQPATVDGSAASVLAQTTLTVAPGQAGALDYSPTLAFGARGP
jgi:hypothetical protein